MTGTPQVTTEPKIGDKMRDGSIFAGLLRDGSALYTTSADAPLPHPFNEALEYAATLDAHGHQDWRVPTKDELNVLFNNRAAIGGFNISGPRPAGWYWSSQADYGYGAWGQRFSDGHQYHFSKDSPSSVRCVRLVSAGR